MDKIQPGPRPTYLVGRGHRSHLLADDERPICGTGGRKHGTPSLTLKDSTGRPPTCELCLALVEREQSSTRATDDLYAELCRGLGPRYRAELDMLIENERASRAESIESFAEQINPEFPTLGVFARVLVLERARFIRSTVRAHDEQEGTPR